MKNNLGNIDRIVRLILAAVLLIIAFATNLTSGVATYIIIGVGVILALTALINFCPLYAMFGINTGPKEKK